MASLGVSSAAQGTAQDSSETDRQLWLRQLVKLADPVLRNLAAGTLKRNMPVECRSNVLPLIQPSA